MRLAAYQPMVERRAWQPSGRRDARRKNRRRRRETRLPGPASPTRVIRVPESFSRLNLYPAPPLPLFWNGNRHLEDAIFELGSNLVLVDAIG